MIASEARLAANRANALKSTGPRTAEGKARSRCNALKHGLTGEGVAIPGEDADAVAARLDAFEADLGPVTEAGRALARRAAILSIRLDRCVVHESAAIARDVRAAEAEFDEAREAEADRLLATIGESPGANLRRLRRMPEGVDRILDAWADLRADLAHGDGSRWSADHTALAVHLSGRKPGAIGIARAEALGRAICGDPSLLAHDDAAGLDPRGRRDWARRAMASLIDEAARELEGHSETLDLAAIAADRAGAAARALFDPSKEATLARKYEAAAERELYRALREIRTVEAEADAADRAEIAPAPRPPLASFSPATAPRPCPTLAAPSPAPPAPRSPGREGSAFVPITAGRPVAGTA